MTHLLKFEFPEKQINLTGEKRPLWETVSFELAHDNPEQLVWRMWAICNELDQDVDGIIFNLDGVEYEANAVILHYLFAKGRGDFARDMEDMKVA